MRILWGVMYLGVLVEIREQLCVVSSLLETEVRLLSLVSSALILVLVKTPWPEASSWKKEFILVYGSRGVRSHCGREARQWAAGAAARAGNEEIPSVTTSPEPREPATGGAGTRWCASSSRLYLQPLQMLYSLSKCPQWGDKCSHGSAGLMGAASPSHWCAEPSHRPWEPRRCARVEDKLAWQLKVSRSLILLK